MALEHAENAMNFLYRFTTTRKTSFFYFHFQDLSVLVPTLLYFIDYGKFDSPPNSLQRQPALLPTYFQTILVLFQTSHFEETTCTYPCN